jgi:hypothetical protein
MKHSKLLRILLILGFSSALLAENVGLVIQKTSNKFFIKEIIKGCPASGSAFIKVGDQIEAIRKNGESEWVYDLSAYSLLELMALIKDEDGEILDLGLVGKEGQLVARVLRRQCNT